MHFTYEKWISAVPFFHLTFEGLSPTAEFAAEVEYKGFIKALAVVVQPIMYAPLEVVLRQHQTADALYVLS